MAGISICLAGKKSKIIRGRHPFRHMEVNNIESASQRRWRHPIRKKRNDENRVPLKRLTPQALSVRSMATPGKQSARSSSIPRLGLPREVGTATTREAEVRDLEDANHRSRGERAARDQLKQANKRHALALEVEKQKLADFKSEAKRALEEAKTQSDAAIALSKTAMNDLEEARFYHSLEMEKASREMEKASREMEKASREHESDMKKADFQLQKEKRLHDDTRLKYQSLVEQQDRMERQHAATLEELSRLRLRVDPRSQLGSDSSDAESGEAEAQLSDIGEAGPIFDQPDTAEHSLSDFDTAEWLMSGFDSPENTTKVTLRST